MSSRLDQDREKRLQPQRILKAISEIEALDIEIDTMDETSIKFQFDGSTVTYHAYSGWASGKSIRDGRGLNKLLKQLKK